MSDIFICYLSGNTIPPTRGMFRFTYRARRGACISCERLCFIDHVCIKGMCQADIELFKMELRLFKSIPLEFLVIRSLHTSGFKSNMGVECM